MMATETKNIKEFYNTEIPSDWEETNINEMFYFKQGVQCAVDNQFEICTESRVRFIRIIDLTDSNEPIRYIDDPGKEHHVLPDDLFMIRYGTPGVLGYGYEGVIANNLFRIIPKTETNNHFYYYQLTFKERQIQKLASSSTMPALNFESLSQLKVLVPPLPEQKAIAQVLSTADAAIHTTEKIIAQKVLRKKWLMQQLLTGKKRLNGFENTKWKIQPLENFIKPIVREVPKPSTPYLGIGLRSHGKGTFLKHDEQPEKNSMDNFYVVRPNDLIVNITFAWEQAIAIVRPEDDGALASHRFPTYTFIEDKGHPDFFRFYILQPRMKFMLQMISPGGAGRNRVMSKSDFIKLEFLLPDYKEQTAIAQVLQAADKEIGLLKAKAEKLREQKKGLMQQLLTGKVRLKIK